MSPRSGSGLEVTRTCILQVSVLITSIDTGRLQVMYPVLNKYWYSSCVLVLVETSSFLEWYQYSLIIGTQHEYRYIVSIGWVLIWIWVLNYSLWVPVLGISTDTLDIELITVAYWYRYWFTSTGTQYMWYQYVVCNAFVPTTYVVIMNISLVLIFFNINMDGYPHICHKHTHIYQLQIYWSN
jgi:hypothetical protein